MRINAKLITNAKLYIYSVCLNAAKKKPATMINDKNNINAKVFSSFPMNKITKSKVAEEIATTTAWGIPSRPQIITAIGLKIIILIKKFKTLVCDITLKKE